MKQFVKLCVDWLAVMLFAVAASAYEIKQSTSAQPLVFFMVDSTDHVSGKTGLTPTVTIRKVGGSFASPAGAVTEIAHGWYQVAGNTTDTNTLGPLLLHATATGADPADRVYEIVAYDPQDATPAADVTAIAGSSTPATALGEAFDGDRVATTVFELGALYVNGGITVIGTTDFQSILRLNDGLQITRSTADSNGVVILGSGTGNGIQILAGPTGAGLSIAGGGTSGDGILVTASNGDGLELRGAGNNTGLRVTGAGTGHGAFFTSGSGATGNGIQATAASMNGSGLGLTGTGTGFGLTGTVGGTVNANVTQVLGDPVCD